MNVIIANKYKDALASLDIDIIKKLDGEFTVEEIISTFENFFFQRMILDITALKEYKDIKTLQKLSLALDMDKLILLLDNSPEVTNSTYLSDLISMRIYNFTMNVDGVKYLYDNPNSYRDVAQYHQLDVNAEVSYGPTPVAVAASKVIGIKNLTEHAGATTLTYLMKRQLQKHYGVVALEVDKRDFTNFNEPDMVSITSLELGNYIAKYNDKDVILVDLNNSSSAQNVVNDVLCLVEPSKIKLSKMLAKTPRIFDEYKNKKIVLNQSLLSEHDVMDFEYEAKVKVFYNLPPLYDQSDDNEPLDKMLLKLGFGLQQSESPEDKKGIFDKFK